METTATEASDPALLLGDIFAQLEQIRGQLQRIEVRLALLPLPRHQLATDPPSPTP